MRDTYLPFAQPDLDEREIEAVTACLREGWITSGPRKLQFETRFAEIMEVPYALAVNSCTAAMHLALEALGVRENDDVITSPYTFAATAEVIRYLGANPVFVDVQPDTLTIDPQKVAAAVTDRTRAIMPVHFGGLAAELSPIYQLAADRNLAVVEDCAHSLPTWYHGTIIGGRPAKWKTFPWAACFSFYATKPLTTGEGGMVCTDDRETFERCRLMSLHGITSDGWARYTHHGSWYYEIREPGYKYNMTDVAAAMGLVQLEKLQEMWSKRAEVARRFGAAFEGHPALQPPLEPETMRSSWHLYPLRLNLNRLDIDRAAFVEQLRARNIGTSVHFIPLHLHPYYRQAYGYSPDAFPVAYREYLREISLPIYSTMTDEDVSDVIEAVIGIADEHLVQAG